MNKRIGITGQAGFIGTHLANYLLLKPTEVELVPFEDDFYKDKNRLYKFVTSCDAIFHLAAMNRGEPSVIYECNVRLTRDLIDAMERTKSKPDVIFASSIQEDLDNSYGNSKREGRKLFIEWSTRNNARFIGLTIPNVFGPFGLPFYNSAIATFCHQLTSNLQPKIEVDAELKLIYINDLVEFFYETFHGLHDGERVIVPHIMQIKVSEILKTLLTFQENYFTNNMIPDIKSYFDLCLFNTFRSFIPMDHFPVPIEMKIDDRGHLAEIVKSKIGGQVFFSYTKPGIIRGNHFHRRKVERFCVIEGEAEIKLRRIGTTEVLKLLVTGKNPSFVDIPVFYTHNIKNIGTNGLYTLFWSSEIHDSRDPDTYMQEVE